MHGGGGWLCLYAERRSPSHFPSLPSSLGKELVTQALGSPSLPSDLLSFRFAGPLEFAAARHAHP